MIKCNTITMIPLLLISENKRHIDKYLRGLAEGKNSVIIEILPQTAEYSIDQIKQLSKETKIFHPEKRIYLLTGFNRSSIPAQNAFLKLLEEPPNNTLFVLTARSEYSLLPTVVSRTQIIHLDRNQIIINSRLQTDLEQLVRQKNLNLPLIAASQKDALEAVNQMVLFFRKRFLTDKKAAVILKEIIKVKNLLENNNLSPQLAIDHLLIFIRKSYSIK